MPSTRTLAVIPARAGSKRIPDKNSRSFCGKPLIVHTIEAALGTGLFSEVVVSTDAPVLQRIALEAGASCPTLRHPGLADDVTPVAEVTLALLAELQARGEDYDHVAQLLPTSPLRSADDVRESHASFLEVPRSPLISVTAFAGANPWWALVRAPDGKMQRVFEAAFAERSQDQPELLAPTGAVWWIGAERLRAARSFYADDTRAWEIPWPRGLDIDTPRDWTLAERMASACGRPA